MSDNLGRFGFFLFYTLISASASASSDVSDTEYIYNDSSGDTYFLSPHIYVGARNGWTIFQDACSDTHDKCKNETFGYGFYGGVQLTSWLAIEGGWMDYGKPSSRDHSGDTSASIKSTELTGRFSYQLTSNAELFSRLGVSYQKIVKEHSTLSNTTFKESNFNPLISIGASYYLSPNWSLSGEFQFIDGVGDANVKKADVSFTSVGLTYHFGRSLDKTSLNSSQDEHVSVLPQTQVALSAPTKNVSVSLSIEQLFEYNSAKLKYSQDLEDFANQLTRFNNGTVNIIGHADSSGSRKYNQELSVSRALSVAEYLKNMGVNQSQLSVHGFGEDKPIAVNDTEEGRRLNRRVEIRYNEVSSDNFPSDDES